MSAKVYGWFEFRLTDANDTYCEDHAPTESVFRFAVYPTPQAWSMFTFDRTSLQVAFYKSNTSFGDCDVSAKPGHVAILTSSRIPSRKWDSLITYWREFFDRQGLVLGETQEVAQNEKSLKDQERIQAFEDFKQAVADNHLA